MARNQIFNTIMITDGPSTLQQRIEYAGDGSATYIGYAIMGAGQTDDAWTISYMIYTNQQMTLKQTAFGAWSDRASLVYS